MSGEMVAEWASTTLKEAAAELFTDGDWVESKDQDPDGEVRLIQLADIGDGSFLNKSARFLTTAKARELRCTLLRPGDLLIARMADPIARCCLFPGLDQPAATVVDVSIVRPGPEVDRDYLAYAISNPAFRAEALGSASGTTRSRISRSNLGAITVPLPPHDEQRRIAEVLRSVDEAIAASQKVADQALAIWHGLTESLIWQQMVSQPHCAQPLGNALERSDYGVNASLSNEPGGSAVLRMGNLQSGWIDPTDLKWGEIADAEVRSLALDVGDILFNRTNSRDLVGKVALVREPTDFIYASYIVRLRPNHAVADRGGLAKLDSGISGFSA